MSCSVKFPLGTIINAAYPGSQVFSVSSNETVHVEIEGQVLDHEANWFIANQLPRNVFCRVNKSNSNQIEFAVSTLDKTHRAIFVGSKPILDLLIKQRELEGACSQPIFFYDRVCEQRFFPPAAAPSEEITCNGPMTTVALVLGAAVAINFIAMKQSGWF